jgi:hypothetical protein
LGAPNTVFEAGGFGTAAKNAGMRCEHLVERASRLLAERENSAQPSFAFFSLFVSLLTHRHSMLSTCRLNKVDLNFSERSLPKAASALVCVWGAAPCADKAQSPHIDEHHATTC